MTSIYFKVSEKVFINRQKGFLHRYVLSFHWKVLKEVCKFIYIYKYLYFNKICKKLEKNSDITVSITSYPKRINNLHITVKSVLKQTIRPKKIIIWLFKDEFPDGINMLPKKLTNLFKYNVEVKFIDTNLKSHLKYYYVFKNFPDNYIITLDDDIIYYPNTIERLLKMHKMNPNTICANVAKKIEIKNNEFLPYNKWNIIKNKEINNSRKYIALGVGGVLYPPNLIDKNILFDPDTIKSICLNADDLWLKACSFIYNTKITTGGSFFPNPITIPNSQKVGLRTTNVNENLNDIQWEKICQRLKIEPKDFV